MFCRHRRGDCRSIINTLVKFRFFMRNKAPARWIFPFQGILSTLCENQNELVCISHAAAINSSESSPLPERYCKDRIVVARRRPTSDGASRTKHARHIRLTFSLSLLLEASVVLLVCYHSAYRSSQPTTHNNMMSAKTSIIVQQLEYQEISPGIKRKACKMLCSQKTLTVAPHFCIIFIFALHGKAPPDALWIAPKGQRRTSWQIWGRQSG